MRRPPAAPAAADNGRGRWAAPWRGTRLRAETTSWTPTDSSGCIASSASTRRGSPLGSRRSTCATVDGENTVRGRIHMTVSPASSNSSRSCSAPKQRVIVPSGHGTSTTSACGRSVSSAQCRCSASRAMPRTRESTQASTRPAGRSTRAMSVIRFSAASCRDRVRSSAITPSAHPSRRNDRLAGSDASWAIRLDVACAPGGGKTGGSSSPGGPGRRPAVSVTRSTVWPAAAAVSAAHARGPEMSTSRQLSRGSQDASCASATAW